MRTLRFLLPSLVLAAGLAAAEPATLTLDQCPQAVKDALTKAANGAAIDKVEKKEWKDKVVYTVVIPGKDGAKETKIRVLEDGTLVKGHGGHKPEGAQGTEAK